MKKLLVVLSALFLIVAFAVPVMASDIEFSGEFRVGFITLFDEAKDAAAYGRIEFDVSAKVDDYNTVELEFDAEQSGVSDIDLAKGEVTYSKRAVDMGYAKLVTDLGGAFNLPIDLTMTSGAFVPETEDYDAPTDLGYADDQAGGDIEPDSLVPVAHEWLFGFGPANFRLATTVAEGTGGSMWDFLAELDVPEIGPASFDVYYEVDDNQDFEGAVGTQIGATVGPADVGVGFEYNVSTEAWAYGIGAAATFAPATFGVALNGNDVDTLNLLGIDLTLAPTEDYGLNLGVGLSFADDAEDTFQGFEASAYYMVGAAEFRLGYLYTEYEFAYYAPTNSYDTTNADGDPLGGGLFARFDIDF